MGNCQDVVFFFFLDGREMKGGIRVYQLVSSEKGKKGSETHTDPNSKGVSKPRRPSGTLGTTNKIHKKNVF